MTFTLIILISGVIGFAVPNILPRYLPKYQPGTPVVCEFDDGDEKWEATYVCRSGLFRYHRVRLVRDTNSWWSAVRVGGIIVVRTSDMSAVTA